MSRELQVTVVPIPYVGVALTCAEGCALSGLSETGNRSPLISCYLGQNANHPIFIIVGGGGGSRVDLKRQW